MRTIFTAIGLLCTSIIFSQNYLHQVLVLNEGYYDYGTSTIVEPVRIGSYNPANQTYTDVNILNGMRFASDLIIEGNAYYVAADTKIFKFDINTHMQLAEVSCPGVRNLGIYQNKLVATRGEYLTSYDSYLHVYNASTLQLIAAIDTIQGPKWASQNISIVNDIAYIAVNNGYEWGNEKGIIGQLHLNSMIYDNEVDLGPDGKNPDNLIQIGGQLVTVNNKDWSGTSVSKLDLATQTVSTTNIANVSTGCGTSALLGDKIIYQISMAQDLNEFDVNLMSNLGPISGYNLNFYELSQEPLSGNLFASETDYTTFGSVHIYSTTHTEISQFNAGVSPGTFGFDVRSSASINENPIETNLIYPNPSNGKFSVIGFEDGSYTLQSMDGKIVKTMNQSELNVNDLNSGIYILSRNGLFIGTIQKN